MEVGRVLAAQLDAGNHQCSVARVGHFHSLGAGSLGLRARVVADRQQSAFRPNKRRSKSDVDRTACSGVDGSRAGIESRRDGAAGTGWGYLAEAQKGDRFVSPYQMAMAYARLHDADLAISFLQKSADARESQILYFKFDPDVR